MTISQPEIEGPPWAKTPVTGRVQAGVGEAGQPRETLLIELTSDLHSSLQLYESAELAF